MTKGKSIVAKAYTKYIAPTVCILSTAVNPVFAQSGKAFQIAVYNGACHWYPVKSIKTTDFSTTVTTTKVCHNPTLGSGTQPFIVEPGVPKSVCLQFNSHIVSMPIEVAPNTVLCFAKVVPNAGFTSNNNITSKTGINASVGTRLYNRLLTLKTDFEKSSLKNSVITGITPTSDAKDNIIKRPTLLAEISLKLTLTELNKVPGGFQVKPSEKIDDVLLTPQQRTVLFDHRGLMQEAIRQLKEKQKAQA